MINLKNTKQSYGLGKAKKALPKKKPNKSECSNTKESSIKRVFDCIKRHKATTKKQLMKLSGVSANTIKRSLLILIERGLITFKVIGYAGPYEIKILPGKLFGNKFTSVRSKFL